MKLLLVDDEVKLIDDLSHLLKKNGFVVDSASDGQMALDLACTGIYDILLLNRRLPLLDGLSLLKQFRSMDYDTPVMLLTVNDSPEDRAEGLNAGADDCLVKPFSTVELLARLQALSRRKNSKIASDILVVDGLVFDPMRNTATKNGEVIPLTFKEAKLLELLIRNVGQVITKELISQKVWGFNSDTDISIITLYVHYLRKKLQISGLKTVRGVGYYLEKGTVCTTPGSPLQQVVST